MRYAAATISLPTPVPRTLHAVVDLTDQAIVGYTGTAGGASWRAETWNRTGSDPWKKKETA